MEILETGIPGCFELRPPLFRDERGVFVKTFHRELFQQQGLVTAFAEEYYTCSHHGVLRGLHFQTPPHDHVKLVCCPSGEVLDVVLDLRRGSPTFGQHALFSLSGERGNMLHIPRGVAHGFYVTGTHALMLYKVTSVHAPEHDTGILWNSAGIPWPSDTPLISRRDGELPSFKDFVTPFRFEGGGR